jgi:hypothetical protein
MPTVSSCCPRPRRCSCSSATLAPASSSATSTAAVLGQQCLVTLPPVSPMCAALSSVPTTRASTPSTRAPTPHRSRQGVQCRHWRPHLHPHHHRCQLGAPQQHRLQPHQSRHLLRQRARKVSCTGIISIFSPVDFRCYAKLHVVSAASNYHSAHLRQRRPLPALGRWRQSGALGRQPNGAAGRRRHDVQRARPRALREQLAPPRWRLGARLHQGRLLAARSRSACSPIRPTSAAARMQPLVSRFNVSTDSARSPRRRSSSPTTRARRSLASQDSVYGISGHCPEACTACRTNPSHVSGRVSRVQRRHRDQRQLRLAHVHSAVQSARSHVRYVPGRPDARLRPPLRAEPDAGTADATADTGADAGAADARADACADASADA